MQSESTAASVGEDATSSKARGASSLQDEIHNWESTNAKSFDTAPSSSLSSSSVTTHQSLSDFSEQLRCWRQDEEQGLQALSPTPEVIDEPAENLSDCSLRKHKNVALQDFSWDGAEDLDLVKQQLAILRQIQLDHHEATLKAESRDRSTPDAAAVDVKKAPHSHFKRHDDETPLASNASFSTCVTSSLASATTSSQGRSFRSTSNASSPTKRRSAECHESVLSSHEDKILEEGKWLDHFNDPSAIREQHEIMQQIEDDKHRARLLNAPSRTTPARNEGNSRPTSSSLGIFTLENSKIERGPHFANRPAASAFGREGSSLEANWPPSADQLQPNKTNPVGGNQTIGGLKLSNSEGGTTCTYGRRKLHVLGKTKTVNAIAEGTALLVQCPGCRTVLQVSSGAKLVYCTVCSGVSPIELVHNDHHDQAIAAAVQDAERDLSYQQGLEKQRRRPR
jgi:LSD1 subclass zinc finger protein